MRFTIFAALVPFALAACAQPTPLADVTLSDPSSPVLGITTVAPLAVAADFTMRPPTGPAPWRIQNDAQSPAGGGSN